MTNKKTETTTSTTTPAAKRIWLIKMMAGDLIVGNFMGKDESGDFILENPHFLVSNPQGAMALAPYIPLFKETTRPFNHLTMDTQGEANEMITTAYLEATVKTQLVLPKKSKLLIP